MKKQIKTRVAIANRDLQGQDLNLFTSSKEYIFVDVGQTNLEIKQAALDCAQFVKGSNGLAVVTSIIHC